MTLCPHKHAVTSLSGGDGTYTYDAENRMISLSVSGQTTQFIYDGDGNLVKKVKPDNSKTIYVGGIYKVDKTSGGSVTRTVTYYPAAGAMLYNFSHSSREIPACFRILDNKSLPISP
jgi:YD repeat-containing protein